MSLKITQIGILFISLILIFNSCNSKEQTKQKELNLNARELNVQEKESENQIPSKTKKYKTLSSKKNKKELRFLYYANGGIRGFFDDGTIVGCPKCDFCKTNILTMFNKKPIGTYEVQSDGSLIINNSEREFPNYNEDNGWVLIDYKWNEKIPQN